MAVIFIIGHERIVVEYHVRTQKQADEMKNT